MKYKLKNPIDKSYSAIEQVLTNRGIAYSDIFHYTHTTDNDINPPEALGEDLLVAAATTLIKIIQKGEKVIIIVD